VIKEIKERLDFAILHAGKASSIAMQYYGSSQKDIKEDLSPVTKADLEVDKYLQEQMACTFAEDGWLSEESADNLKRCHKTYTWIVEPAVGTTDDQLVVNIGSAEFNNLPVALNIQNTDDLQSVITDIKSMLYKNNVLIDVTSQLFLDPYDYAIKILGCDTPSLLACEMEEFVGVDNFDTTVS